ncbi:MAG: VOC family protein [Pseudanabaena sp. ELA607]|jgi:lactoylglutathione lyase
MEIDYIALFVADVNTSIVFYRDVLGFSFSKPIKNGGVEGTSGQLKIGLYQREWLEKLFAAQLPHHTFDFDNIRSLNPFLLSMTVDDLEAVYQHLQNYQVKILQPPQIMPWGQKLLFCQDPDGNFLEMVQRQP